MLRNAFLTALFIHGLVVNAASSSSSSEEDDGSSEHENEEHKKAHSHHWGYTDQLSWGSVFNDCNGQSQSPIDINTNTAIYDAQLPSIKLAGYDLTDNTALTLLNNGHTLQLSLPGSMRVVSGFDRIYHAAQLHFHWGSVEEPGSEHTIDNVHFPAEIHVVHYNSKYANLSEAATKEDGLAVLGAFIGIGLHENENYEKILSALTDVSLEETKTEIPGFNVRHLLPNSLERFYRYTGSLTTPPCFQTVNWTMFNDTITVSRKQVSWLLTKRANKKKKRYKNECCDFLFSLLDFLFSLLNPPRSLPQLAALEDTLKMEQNQLLSKNFRAPQLLHGRRVVSSFSASPEPQGPKIIPLTEAGPGTRVRASTGAGLAGLSRGDILAIAFGALFAVTLLAFSTYAYQQRKKYSKFKKDSRQNVIYKPATKEEA
ncbi:carbonic anhydrase 14 isoform X1 [Clupea harengus]|uniref:Carbonic anhydrase n=1 Tax=Clupea harengus TaxID=7950 RepID=A0A8M1KRT5_CLUHA|nr:carbonic anhydrase 14 isoform X1 [Clupea harengus]